MKLFRLKTNNSIKLGFKEARTITKNHAKTFYFASCFFPRNKRQAAYAVYALCRASDESVDTGKNISCHNRLAQISEKIAAVFNNSPLGENLLLAFRETVKRYHIPREYFAELLAGMQMDLEKDRYQNFEELHPYCFRVAGVVGLIMLKILGYKNPQAEKYAIDLGVAMQLTNILRDIREDFERGRVYLPQDEMARFGVSESSISQAKIDNNFVALLKFQIKRARQYYASSSAGIGMISNLRSRFVVLAMKEIYSGILTSIENNAYHVFSQRAQVATKKKVIIALKILFRGQYL